MKKIALLLAVLSLLSCSKDDETPSVSIDFFNVAQNGSEITLNYGTSENMQYYEFSYDISLNGNQPGNGDRFSSTENSQTVKSITDLNLSTEFDYFFYIRGLDQNGNFTEWFGPQVLTLEDFCNGPRDLFFDGYVSWDSGFNTQPTLYEVQYGQQGFQLGNGEIIQTNNEVTYDLVLEQGQVYDAYVRSYCDINLGWSTWVGPISYRASDNINVCTVPPTNLSFYTEYNFFGDPVGANISWLDSGNNKKYEFNLVGHNASPLSNATEFRDDYGTQITYTQITPNAFYSFYVRTVCLDGSTTDWAGPLTVRIN